MFGFSVFEGYSALAAHLNAIAAAQSKALAAIHNLATLRPKMYTELPK